MAFLLFSSIHQYLKENMHTSKNHDIHDFQHKMLENQLKWRRGEGLFGMEFPFLREPWEFLPFV